MFAGEELFGGEFDGVGPAAGRAGCAGEFEGGEIVADGEGDFSRDELGVRRNYAGADDAITMVCEKFDKAITKRTSFASGNVGKFDERFFVFAVTAE